MRSARAVLVALVVVSVGLGLAGWRRGGRAVLEADQATPASASPPSLDQARVTTSPTPTTQGFPALSATVGPGDTDVGPGELEAQLWDPRRSDLPPDEAAGLSVAGVAVLRADLTGVGRDRYPAYFGGPAARPCCTELTVVAAGARRHEGHADLADVTVVWTAHLSVDPGPPLRRVSRVMLVRGPGGWEPVHPWEVGG